MYKVFNMKNDFGLLYERDMDILFMSLFQTDESYVRFVLERAEIPFQNFEVLSVELSHTELGLGESDITVRIDIDGCIHGLLVEDKIDAIAMKNQHQRYIKRGEVGIQKGYYQFFHEFIFCPEKYLKKNKEAKEYLHSILYEEFAAFYSVKNDSLSLFRRSQFESAIEQSRNPSQAALNEKANTFFRKYYAYQQEHFHRLWLTTQLTSNGYWVRYRTSYPNANVIHKVQEGYVDLVLPNCVNKMYIVEKIVNWARNENKMKNVSAHRTAKNASVRIKVPSMDMSSQFESVSPKTLIQCFGAITALSDIAFILRDSRDKIEK